MKRSFLAAACVLSLSALMSAHAAPLVIGASVEVADLDNQAFLPTPVVSDTDGLRKNVYFSLNGGIEQGASAGLLVLDQRPAGSNGGWSPLLAFCLEPDAWLSPFNNPYTVKSLPGAGYAASASGAISELWGRYFSQVTNDTNAAAFQVAVWELAYGTTDKNLATGDFILTASTSNLAAVRNTAQSWLTNLNGDVTQMAQGLVALQDNEAQRNKQDLLTQGQATPLQSQQNQVPEPGMLGLLAAGLTGLGLARRRARRPCQA